MSAAAPRASMMARMMAPMLACLMQAVVALACPLPAAAAPVQAGPPEIAPPHFQARTQSPARPSDMVRTPGHAARIATDRIAGEGAGQGAGRVLVQAPVKVSGQIPSRFRPEARSPVLPRSLSRSPVEIQTQACRQALALGLDVSASVDATEYRLQLDGLAHALLDPGVLSKLLVPGMAPVEIAVFEWSGHRYQAVLVDWIVISDLAAVERLADLLRLTQRRPAPRGTAIGAAMQKGVDLLNRRADCWKRTLDLSGDGQNNVGLHPLRARALAEAAGVTINALVIGTDTARLSDQRQAEISALSSYFRANVITGPDAFVQTALGYEAYAQAMTAKLIRELDSLAVSQADDPAPLRTQPQ